MFQYYDFVLFISIVDLVIYDESDFVHTKTELIQIFDLLHIKVDFPELYESYFNKIKVGEGDVVLYKNKCDDNSFLVMNLYRDIYDQLDLITLGVRCPLKESKNIQSLIRTIHDSAQFSISYSESQQSEKVNQLSNANLFPRAVTQIKTYNQSLVIL